MFIDESHVTIGQLGACTKATARARRIWSTTAFACPRHWTIVRSSSRNSKQVMRQTVFVSATPAEYERKTSGQIVEQVGAADGPRRPASRGAARLDAGGRPAQRDQPARGERERVLVTTLTKRMAEELTDYLAEHGVEGALPAFGGGDGRAGRNHPRPAPGRIRRARRHQLLREGLDLPEVSLVAILDADKEGFLRSERSLIQTIGRAGAPFERGWPFSTRTRSPIR